jgi:hypothetical protein
MALAIDVEIPTRRDEGHGSSVQGVSSIAYITAFTLLAKVMSLPPARLGNGMSRDVIDLLGRCGEGKTLDIDAFASYRTPPRAKNPVRRLRLPPPAWSTGGLGPTTDCHSFTHEGTFMMSRFLPWLDQADGSRSFRIDNKCHDS